ncbi:KH domain-containing protein [bacterium]|nr:KH domain-containing protein [bacterium]
MVDSVKDKDFLETIVRSIVAKPEGVSVERSVDEMGVLLTLKVDPEDMGNVIGRRGQTAQAIRTLLKIVGAKNNARVNLKIYDPNQGQGGSVSNRSEEVDTSNEEVDTSSVEDLKI